MENRAMKKIILIILLVITPLSQAMFGERTAEQAQELIKKMTGETELAKARKEKALRAYKQQYGAEFPEIIGKPITKDFSQMNSIYELFGLTPTIGGMSIDFLPDELQVKIVQRLIQQNPQAFYPLPLLPDKSFNNIQTPQ